MKLNIDKADIENLKALKKAKLNHFLNKIDNIEEKEAIEFMELLYDMSNEYLGKDYKDTSESLLLEKIADYIYDKTNL